MRKQIACLTSTRNAGHVLDDRGGPDAGRTTASLAEMWRLGLEIMLLSRKEVDYPVMREIHAASSFTSAGALVLSTGS